MKQKIVLSKSIKMFIVLFLIVVLPVVIVLVQKNQENRSKAALTDLVDGVCGSMKSTPCVSGNYSEKPEDSDAKIIWTCEGDFGGKSEVCHQLKD